MGLLAETATGREASFAELYRETSPLVYGVVFHTLRSRDHAEEVVQETYSQIWRQAGAYDYSRGSALGWIVMIARRRAIDRVRSTTRAAALEARFATHGEAASGQDVGEEVASRLDAERVRQALAGLTPLQREAVLLRYFQSHSLKQMAAELQLPLGTVKTRIRDGLIRLRRGLEAGVLGESGGQTSAAL